MARSGPNRFVLLLGDISWSTDTSVQNFIDAYYGKLSSIGGPYPSRFVSILFFFPSAAHAPCH
jgi:hypothetical protein